MNSIFLIFFNSHLHIYNAYKSVSDSFKIMTWQLRESENKSAELMFPNWFWTPKLKVLHFSSHECCSQPDIVHVSLFSDLSQSLIPHFSNKLKKIWILKDKV